MNLPAYHSLVCSFFIIILFLHEAQPSSLLRSVSTPFFFFFFKSTKHVLLWQILNVMTHLAEIRVSEPRNNSKNNSRNFTRGRMGLIQLFDVLSIEIKIDSTVLKLVYNRRCDRFGSYRHSRK